MSVNATSISVARVFEQLKAQHPNVLLLKFFETDFIKQCDPLPNNKQGWQEQLLSEGEAGFFMQSVIDGLEKLANRFAHTTDDPVYGEATTLAQAVHSILVEHYGFQPCTIRIMSPTRTMEAAGLVDVIRGDDGELYVKPKQG